MNKVVTMIITVLVVIISVLFFNSYHLSTQVEKREKELAVEQETNIALGNIIDAYRINEIVNRAATVRQLDNERRLRNESDERLNRFKAVAIGGECVDSRMPDSLIDILRE